MKKLLLAIVIFNSLSSMGSTCTDSFQSDEQHIYTPIAYCDEIITSNVGGKAYLTIKEADICVVKDESFRGLFKKTYVLISGRINSKFTNSENGGVLSALYSSSRIKGSIPTPIRNESKYFNSVELDIYDSNQQTLTTKTTNIKGTLDSYAVLKCQPY